MASNALRTVLDAAYPSLDIDPVQAMVVTPTWTVSGDQVTSGPHRYESLTDALVRLTLSAQTATYIDGEHFLTLQPGVESAIQLPVKIDDIGRLINKLIPLLFVSYQEQQLDYWNQPTEDETPRWHQLSGSLRNLWNIEQVSDWDEDEKAMALALFNNPDKTSRNRNDAYTSRACLIDIDEPDKHLWVLDVAVLVGTLGTRTLVISHSITEGFKRYDSLQAFSETLSARVASTSGSRTFQWRLYEPTGHFFDHQACALIALEVAAIGQLQGTITNGGLAHQAMTAARNRKNVDEGRFSRIERLLPEWLLSAQPADLTCYSRHLMDLAQLREQHGGKSFLDDIPPLPVFTLQALKDQVLKDHPEATDARLETIELSITSQVILSAIAVPGKTETVTLSLIDLALQNLIAVPLGNKTVRRTDGSAVESWMTPDYLEKLVTEVDIGETYPALIKQNYSVTRRKHNVGKTCSPAICACSCHFRRCSTKFVVKQASMIRGTDSWSRRCRKSPATALWTARKSSFVRWRSFRGRTGNKADEVANMFVIGPRLADKGPCLLFRPLLDPPLLQYPRETNLLYAIKHNQTLRQSVLAWLPDDVRFNYSQYVFTGQLPSVWTLSQWLVDPASVLGMMGAVRLAAVPLAPLSLSAVFTANANAMITLADRQSVSNAQSRWQTLKQGAWVLFNIALPFLGKTAASATWIWQIMSDLDQANEASQKGDSGDAWTALTDLFLSLGMVLAHYAATRHTTSRAIEKQALTLKQQPVPRPTITVIRLPDITAQRLPANHKSSVYTQGALARTSLVTLLDGLSIAKPEGLSAPRPKSAPTVF